MKGAKIMAKAKKLKSGNWRVQVFDYVDENKKKHYKSFTASTKKEAEYMASEYAFTRKDSTYEDMTLQEAYESYIKSKSSVLSPSTIAGYNRYKKLYFSKLMPMKLSKITPRIIQTAVNELSAEHSPKTVRNAHGLLSAVLKSYCPSIDLNTTLPQKIKPAYIIPTTEEVKRLLSVANDRMRVPILLASQGGLRRSEICALTVDDFTDIGVNINKAVVYDKDKKTIVKTTKTQAGTRFVPLPKNVIDECKNWKYFGCTPASISDGFAKCVKKSNIPKISIHKLRHYFASELHASGIPDQYIAEIGGWGNISVLQEIYQHTLRDKQKVMGNKVINIFTNNFLNGKDKNKKTV